MNSLFHKQTRSVESANVTRYLVKEVLCQFTYLLIGGTLWQGLLLHNGCSATEIGTLSAIGSVAQSAAMGVNILLSDRFKKPIFVMTVANSPIFLFFAAIALLCYLGSAAFSFPLLAVLTTLYYASFGFRSTFAYKIPYLIIHMENYGRLVAVTGLVSNIFCIAVTAGIPFFLEWVEYQSGMLILYITCALFIAINALLNFRLKIICESSAAADKPRFRELLAAAGIAQLYCGVSYYIFFRREVMKNRRFPLNERYFFEIETT